MVNIAVVTLRPDRQARALEAPSHGALPRTSR